MESSIGQKELRGRNATRSTYKGKKESEQEKVHASIKEALISIDMNNYFGDVGINPALGD